MFLVTEYNKFNSKRIVLTGSPGTGKSSVIERLSEIGYKVIPEAARELIEKYVEHNIDCLPWSNRDCFQKNVELKEIENFKNNTYGFFDRSVIDEPAFRLFYGYDVPSDLDTACKIHRYDTVFVFRPWKQIFVNNDYRKITFDEIIGLDEYIVGQYKKYGYNPIDVIKGTIDERVEFIINNI